MPASNVVCFETFRSERDRQRAETLSQPSPAAADTPFRDRLASVLLSPRQIAHRRAMLDFGRRIEPRNV
jgi:hypothetical protein